jgi:hypothetical protein
MEGPGSGPLYRVRHAVRFIDGAERPGPSRCHSDVRSQGMYWMEISVICP